MPERQENLFKRQCVPIPYPNQIFAFPGVDLLLRIGVVLHFSAQGHIIARVKQAIRLGTRLFTTKSKSVGTIIDIFGPTNRPFASIKPDSLITVDSLPPGSALFQAKSKSRGGRSKRRKK
jgi:RNA-binding protein